MDITPSTNNSTQLHGTGVAHPLITALPPRLAPFPQVMEAPHLTFTAALALRFHNLVCLEVLRAQRTELLRCLHFLSRQTWTLFAAWFVVIGDAPPDGMCVVRLVLEANRSLPTAAATSFAVFPLEHAFQGH